MLLLLALVTTGWTTCEANNVSLCQYGRATWECNVTLDRWNVAPTEVEDCVPFLSFRIVPDGGTETRPLPESPWVAVLSLPESGEEAPHEVLNCSSSTERCTCSPNDPCLGSSRACTLMNCTGGEGTSCSCHVDSAIQSLLVRSTHSAFGQRHKSLVPFNLIVYSQCLSSRKSTVRVKRAAVIVPESKAPDTEVNQINMQGRKLHFPWSGRAILRKEGIEFKVKVMGGRALQIPLEFTINSGSLLVILVSTNQTVITEEFIIAGREYCDRLTCVACFEALQYLTCLPTSIRIAFWGIVVLIALTLLAYLRVTLVVLFDFGKGIIKVGRVIVRATKAILRTSLRAGRLLGLGAQRGVRRANARVIGWEREFRIPLSMAMLLIIMVGLGAEACNTNQVAQTTLEQCISPEEETAQRQCNITTRLEVTLPHLSSTACIELKGKSPDEPAFLSLALTLKRVQCTFTARRLYYSFPTKLRTQSVVVCAQDSTCSWQRWCIKNYTQVASLTPFHPLPGGLNCLGTYVGIDSCVLFSSPACLHYKWWLEPNFQKAHEVRAIDSYSCTPEFKVVLKGDNLTQETIVTGDESKIEGISLMHQGTFSGAATFIPENLIVEAMTMREGKDNFPRRPDIAYLSAASPGGSPSLGLIGDVQAQAPTSANFTIGPRLVTCSAVKDILKCRKPASPLEQIDLQGIKLPLERGNHLLKLSLAGELYSELLVSPPVRVSLELQNFAVTILTHRVCPDMPSDSLLSAGCHSCLTPASLSFVASSVCQAGRATISLKGATLLQTTVFLSKEKVRITVPIIASSRCPDLVLCVKSLGTEPQCGSVKQCLDDPELSLDGGRETESMQEAKVKVMGIWEQIRDALQKAWNAVLGAAWVPLRLLVGALVLAAMGLFLIALCASAVRGRPN
jgi:hypothetical protein